MLIEYESKTISRSKVLIHSAKVAPGAKEIFCMKRGHRQLWHGVASWWVFRAKVVQNYENKNLSDQSVTKFAFLFIRVCSKVN